MPSELIQFQNVNFSYRGQKIFDHFNWSLNSPEMVGIVGVNGSGKSTLMRLILGLLRPSNGQVKILGQKPGAFKQRHLIGSSMQDIDFPGTEKVIEVLKFVCEQYKDPEDAKQLIEDFNLFAFQNKACGQLSGGMKRRVSLACAFAGKPKIVLLDEPTTGLDRESRNDLLNKLKKYQNKNQALILMISHHPEEVTGSVDQFCHLKTSTMNSISPEEMHSHTQLRKLIFESDKNLTLTDCISSERKGDYYEVVVRDSDQFIRELCSTGFPFKNLEIQKLGADELLEAIQ